MVIFSVLFIVICSVLFNVFSSVGLLFIVFSVHFIVSSSVHFIVFFSSLCTSPLSCFESLPAFLVRFRFFFIDVDSEYADFVEPRLWASLRNFQVLHYICSSSSITLFLCLISTSLYAICLCFHLISLCIYPISLCFIWCVYQNSLLRNLVQASLIPLYFHMTSVFVSTWSLFVSNRINWYLIAYT